MSNLSTPQPLPPELMQAFFDTHYIVHHEAPLIMRIGQP
jgi:hypothetical protein